MANEYPNPWNFSNIDKNLHSPNGQFKVEYGELYEIGMGAPLRGECFLLFDNRRVKLNESCCGPIIWNELSSKIALPIWTKNRNQKIAVVNIEDRTITTYNKEFRVLHFEKFDDNCIVGIDSPIHMTTKFVFDMNNEEIEKVKNIW